MGAVQKSIDKIEDSAMYKLLFQLADEAYLLLDENGFVDCNDKMLSILRCTKTDLYGKRPIDFSPLYQPDGRLSTDLINQYLEQTIKGGIIHFEWQHIRYDGTMFDAEISLKKIEFNNSYLIFTIVRDITKVKNDKKMLELIQRRYKLFTESISDIIWELDNNLRYTYISHSVTPILGYTPEDYIGKTVFDFFEPSTIETYKKDILQILQTLQTTKHTQTEPIELPQKTKSGDIIWIDVRYEPMFDNHGKLIGALGVSRDITAKKKAEIELREKNEELLKAKAKAEESDRLKTAFLQNMSHEIRTPMNAIIGFSSLLNEYFDDKEQLTKFSKIINQKGKDLLEIINDILDFAKLESGQVKIFKEVCYLQTFFSELLLFFQGYRKRIGKENIELIVNNKEPIALVTDKGKLNQILINLISNAFKFTEKGSIVLNCEIIDGNFIQFEVKDSGIGIPVKKQEYVFKRFTQIDDESRITKSGTGLGLSIVQSLVELMGGRVWLYSEEGNGTSFYFTLPYVKPGTDENHKRNGIVKNSSIPLNKSILIVEDDDYNAEFLRLILTKSGFKIYHTTSGYQAIDLCFKNDIVLVLMDIQLPDIDGYETAAQIFKIKPHISIIAQTAYATTAEETKALNAGFKAFLTKPLDDKILLKIVEDNL